MSANPWLKYHRQASIKPATAGRAPTPIAPIAATASAPVASPCAVTAVSTANRQTMPQVAAAVDQLRAVFGTDQVQVVYACENGRELGREPPPGIKPVLTGAGAPKRTARKEGRS